MRESIIYTQKKRMRNLLRNEQKIHRDRASMFYPNRMLMVVHSQIAITRDKPSAVMYVPHVCLSKSFPELKFLLTLWEQRSNKHCMVSDTTPTRFSHSRVTHRIVFWSKPHDRMHPLYLNLVCVHAEPKRCPRFLLSNDLSSSFPLAAQLPHSRTSGQHSAENGSPLQENSRFSF